MDDSPASCFTVAFRAYANGANDNFKGVASLYGSKTCGYRTAIARANVTTAVGSIAALFLASVLLNNFSGKGFVPGFYQSVAPTDEFPTRM